MDIEQYVRPSDFTECDCKNALQGHDFVVLDTETTGLTGNDEVVELGILDKNGCEIYHSYFHPEAKMNPNASRVNGICDSDLKDQPSFAEEYDVIISLLKDKVIVGHNISFDIRLLDQTAGRYRLPMIFQDYTTFDTKSAAKLYMRSNTGKYNLNDLCHQIGVKDEEHHQASYDCLFCLYLLQYIDKMSPEYGTYSSEKIIKEKTPDDKKVKKEDEKTVPASEERKERISPFSGRAKNFQAAAPMLINGESISSVAEKLDLVRSTVEGYVLDLIAMGYLDRKTYASSDILNLISFTAARMPVSWDGKLKPLKETLPSDVSYLQIRLAYREKAFRDFVNKKRRESGYPEITFYTGK